MNNNILGFYKPHEGPDELVGALKTDDYGELYLEIPTSLRNRAEVVVGNIFKGEIAGITDVEGNITKKIGEDADMEVKNYWNELHIDNEDAKKHGLKEGDYLKVVLTRIVQYGEERSL